MSITTIFDNKKCPICGEKLAPHKMPILKSKLLSGIYLVGCSNCTDILMNAGSHIVPVPKDREDLVEEYLEFINNKSIDMMDEIGLSKRPEGQLLSLILEAAKEHYETSKRNKKVAKRGECGPKPETPKAAIFGRPEDFIRIENPFVPKKQCGPLSRQLNTTTLAQDKNDVFLVLDESEQKVAKYEGDKSDAIRKAAKEFGVEALAKGKYTLHKIEKVDIKFKEKISYEIDM